MNRNLLAHLLNIYVNIRAKLFTVIIVQIREAPMIATAENIERRDFTLLLQLGMGIDGFSSEWAYCDRLSSYMAKMVSHNRTDSLLYSNLLSSALNELLETVFRQHRAGGEFMCSIWRNGPYDRIELTIPSDETIDEFYQEVVSRLAQPDIGEQYHNALFREGPLGADIGLMELAVDYAASLSTYKINEQSTCLVAELAIEEAYPDVQ